jgi:methylmalonyl-CoA mutase C-terminal domain/subunit
MTEPRRNQVRVLLAKVGLDGHDRGIKTVARYLADAGMEVIYHGLRSTPDEVVKHAVEQNVDVVGMSFLAGDHMILAPKVIDGLRAAGRHDVMVLLGGIILSRDIPTLKQAGANEVFLPGTPPDQIVQHIQSQLEHASYIKGDSA